MSGALKRGFRSMASLILERNVVGELRPKRTLAASRGFLAAARLSCFTICWEGHVSQWLSYTLHVVAICISVRDRAAVCAFMQIILRYDVLLIQEICDKHETAIEILLNAVNTAAG